MAEVTTEREFKDPVTEYQWTTEGVTQKGASQTIIYRDNVHGSYVRMLRFPVGFGEDAIHAPDEGCCEHDHDEVVYVVSGGLINPRLGQRYLPGSIAVFPQGVAHGPLQAPFGALLLEFRHYKRNPGKPEQTITQVKEFKDPLTEYSWNTEGVQQKGATNTIIYRDADIGSYCRMLKFPVGFGEGVTHGDDEGCCEHDFDEVVFVVSGGLINPRLNERYQPGTIAVFRQGIQHGPLVAPFGALLLEFRHYRTSPRSESKAPVNPSSGLRWYPVIDYGTCSQCLQCVQFCQHGVISDIGGRPVVVAPGSCVEFCRGCAKICPQESIRYEGTSARDIR